MIHNGVKEEGNGPLIVSEANSKYGSTTERQLDDDDEDSSCNNDSTEKTFHSWSIICILSTAFAYGCILTTLFLITLPLECERIQRDYGWIPKSVSLGIFVAIAGVTQLISPLVGKLSDVYVPPFSGQIGQRLPYLVLGSILTVVGLLGQMIFSTRKFWIRYSFAFFTHMIGLNVIYSMMIALIPDQVPPSQTGTANGTLALLLVTGSLFGFALFHSFLYGSIENMYGLYTCIVIFTTVVTCTYAQDGDVRMTRNRQSTEVQPGVVALSPTLLLRTMLFDPFVRMNFKTLVQSYTIDATKHHDFFIVTVSRTFYYMGISVQTFFLYYIHDIVHVHQNPENAVALLAILGQCSGAITCYPVGLLSDYCCGKRRKPFVYLACAILATAMMSLLWCTTMNQVTAVGLVLGAANGMYLTMDTSLAVDTLPKNTVNLDGSCSNDSETAQLLGVWGTYELCSLPLGCYSLHLWYLILRLML